MSRAMSQSLNQQAFVRTKLQSKMAVAVLNGYMVLFSFTEMFNICNQPLDVCIKSTKLCACPRSQSRAGGRSSTALARNCQQLGSFSVCVLALMNTAFHGCYKVFPVLNHSYLSWSNDNSTCTPGNWVTFWYNNVCCSLVSCAEIIKSSRGAATVEGKALVQPLSLAAGKFLGAQST